MANLENAKSGNNECQSSEAQGANDKDNQNADNMTSIIPEKGEPSGVSFRTIFLYKMNKWKIILIFNFFRSI